MKQIVFRAGEMPPHVQAGDQARLFVIRAPEALGALKYWLSTRRYNTFIESEDSVKNTLLGLLYDYDLGQMPSQRRKERGLITVWTPELVIPTTRVVLHYMDLNNEYARWWHDMKLEKINDRILPKV